MEIIEIDQSIFVSGKKVRTKNSNEMDISSSKIAPLWESFFKQVEAAPPYYGVYTNYESDHTGEFDISACCEGSSMPEQIKLPKGKYLKLTNSGELPTAILELWREVWKLDPEKFKRAYKTDYEVYLGDERVELYISII